MSSGNQLPHESTTSVTVYYDPLQEPLSDANVGITHGNAKSKTSTEKPAKETIQQPVNETNAEKLETSVTTPPTKEADGYTTNDTDAKSKENEQSADSQAEPTAKVLLIGNPGVGKSTILNTLVGSAEFESGLSYGTGRTTQLKSYRQGEYEYIDTPGLEDVESREHAAKQISLAFRGPARVILIFVVILDSGRTRAEDLSCMEVVLSALEESELDVKEKHSIIINKCGPEVHRKLAEEGREVMTTFKFVRPVSHVSALKLDRSKIEEDNAMLAEKENLLDFIRSAPTLHISETANVCVDVTAYEEKKRAMHDEVQKLREALASLQDVQSGASTVTPNTPLSGIWYEKSHEEACPKEETGQKSSGSLPEAVRRPWLNARYKISELLASFAAKVPAEKIRPL